MKLIIKYVSFFLLIYYCNIWGQTTNPTTQIINKNASEDFTTNDSKTREAFLKESIKNNPDPNSLFELAKICAEKNTISGREEARKYLRSAIFKEPKNLEYRFLYAQLMEKISSGMSYQVYRDIIEIDSTSSKALYNLGKIKEQDFDDFHNSVFKDGDEPSLSYEKFAQEDFGSAVNFLSKAIKYDPLNREAYLHLSFLFEDDSKPEKGIPLLMRLIKYFPNDEDAHLYLGLLYYETSKIDSSFKEYQKALSLMADSVREDFTYNSVKELLKPIFGDKYKDYSENDFKEIINYFWKITDPLFITNYNERLLEHYSRVAYANLRYSLPDKKIPGWKTDRGEIVLRYGEPIKRIRFRPHINAGGRTEVDMKTDVWYYKNFTLVPYQ
ncbi:MAG: GWxTD domain-containing protein [Bacteroidetes bacterium]|nr:GWxTD domain-containing protein [Bacteroidota bacterium]